ncbi:hypothetical protein J0A68_06690 [Algoriphagus sp. H41]|uniref:HEAT repeat domain-containing protein n=1 Tax=Algoriphagus oliviformis TaxID=2811231 RepID=A0ABS3C116_9BACT|nr:hypothetical protein [Algoriphagus oliviformis]MBN7810633.1 hypothetical protein [Algoriphagus oliviformis]
MAKSLCRIVISLLFFLPGFASALQDTIPEDSAGFRDFLVLQKEVPGLGARFFVAGTRTLDLNTPDSAYGFAQVDSGYLSPIYIDFLQAAELEGLLLSDSVPYRLDYMVLSEPASAAAAREFVAGRIRSGDYLVKTGPEDEVEDLVALASNTRYAPVEKFRLKFVSDYRLFGVTLTIVFFFLVAIIMITSMLIMKAGKNKRENLQKEYSRLIVDPLTTLLFEKDLGEIQAMDQSELDSFFPKNLMAKPLYQHELIDSIIGLNKKMKGDFKEKLKALYKKLGLDKLSVKMLHHKNWDMATMALVQINEMDLVEALPEVKKFTNSKNFHVRSMAVSTLLNLSEKVDLVFLRDQTYPLSHWQQMNYLRIIRFVSPQKDLKLGILFDSKNRSIRLFGIKLVRILGRVDMIEKLSALAGGVSDEEKIEILETYAALGAYMESAFVNECLRSENPSLSLAAAKAAAVVGDAESAEILLELVQSETVFRNKLAYLKGLYGLDAARFAEFTSSDSHPELQDIRDHILDPMLQNV